MTSAHEAILQFSPLESARFDLRVFRGSMETLDAEALVVEIERERVDVAIVRIPAESIGGVNALSQHGFKPIVADTLVSYDIDLADARPSVHGDADVTLRPATRADSDTLERMARAIFADYVTHFHANPLFEREKVLAGYAEWAAQHIEGNNGAAAWLVERAGKPVGFSCYRLDTLSGSASGVLNGILPVARGRGAYRAMLGVMLTAFSEIGMRRFEIATQVHNVAVQRVWTGYGLALRRAVNTVHISALRGRDSGAQTASPDVAIARMSVETR